jgi:hypothetical protein
MSTCVYLMRIFLCFAFWCRYYWTVNGTEIVSDDRVVTFDKDTGTLTTGPLFGELHTGDYQCFASNKYGTAMTPILKIIAVGWYIC